MPIQFENEYVRYVIDGDARNLHFIDKGTGADYAAKQPTSVCARVTRGGTVYDACSASYADGCLMVEFGDAGVRAEIRVEIEKGHFVFEVVSVRGEDVTELVFLNLPLACEGTADEAFCGCSLALNLQTNVEELPGPQRHLWAACYPRFGFVGAKAGLIGCPSTVLRDVMKQAVGGATGLPHAPVGGPWAMDSPDNYGSYLFGRPGEGDVEAWIDLCKSFGFAQMDLSGCLNYGDYQPNKELYPSGYKGLKTVTDKLHAAGIKAGLHAMSFAINKNCDWVTPVPDPRLAKESVFTLAESMDAADTVVQVVEPTDGMPRATGYFIRRSMTLQIDDELIEYSVVEDGALCGCARGACGTQPAAHRAGAKVHHLKQCWGAFVPDGDSTLFTDVAARIARAINECGLDMVYLDGLDGSHVIGGEENRWHYGSKFAFEVFHRLERPTIMEMAAFHHHLWFVRSRMGAWDSPGRGHKTFIDIHTYSNEGCRRIRLPAHLGWWRMVQASDAQDEMTFPDVVEYMCCKALGTDTGFSLQGGLTPKTVADDEFQQRMAAMIRQYEALRLGNHFSESVKKELRKPGAEYTLCRSADGEWRFRPVQYARHKVTGLDGVTNVWKTSNAFGRQPVQLRIEALMAAGPYDADANMVLADFQRSDEFSDRSETSEILNSGKIYTYPSAAPGLCAELVSTAAEVKAAGVSGRFSATNTGAKGTVRSSASDDVYSLFDHGERVHLRQDASWVRLRKTLPTPVDLRSHQGLGVWVHGDGQGELLNVQVGCPRHFDSLTDHYVVIDFAGWRYFELIEPESDRFEEYSWPYGRCVYKVYREFVDYSQIETLNLWYNNVPVGKTVTCYLSPIKAFPLVKATLTDPAVTIGGRTIVFPTEIESGCYLEFRGQDDCTLYSPRGHMLRDVRPHGDVPILEAGENQVAFTCTPTPGLSARANVTVIGEADTFLAGQTSDVRRQTERP